MKTPDVPFVEFPKIARWSREVVVTEKIDGTNAQVFITEDGDVYAGSRTRWITPEQDNYGFASWVDGNRQELLNLGPGSHFGEWWGAGIQRRYGQSEKKFSLFNTARWNSETAPACCLVVPILQRYDDMCSMNVEHWIKVLKDHGSFAAPGFMNPEGVVIYHHASRQLFKKTLEKDDQPKSKVA